MEHYTEIYFDMFVRRSLSFLKHPNVVYKWTKDYRTQNDAAKFAKDIINDIYIQRKEIYMENQQMEAPLGHYHQRKFIDHLFDLTHRKQINFTQQHVKDEMSTFLIAGFDTCTASVSFTLLLLAMHSGVQESVLKEVIDVVGPERPVEYADLAKMTYLEKVIKESLRLFPPTPLIARLADEEFLLDGHIVPKSTQLICYILHIHRSETNWKDPLKFDPERFSPEGITKQENYSFLPFSKENKCCFGTQIAWLILKVVLATLVRRYKLSTPYKNVEDIKIDIKMTLKPVDGVLLRVEDRQTGRR